MVPGLLFDECCIFVLKWTNSPAPHKEVAQIWMLERDGRKTCYLAPGEAEGFFRHYHTFDTVVPAQIDISESDGSMHVRALVKGTVVLTLVAGFRASLKWGIVNFLLRHGNQARFGKQGRTETGRFYHTLPKKIVPLSVERADFEGHRLKIATKPQPWVTIGDGTPAKEPLIVYCTHLLEK
jgi:hypothetical protein